MMTVGYIFIGLMCLVIIYFLREMYLENNKAPEKQEDQGESFDQYMARVNAKYEKKTDFGNETKKNQSLVYNKETVDTLESTVRTNLRLAKTEKEKQQLQSELDMLKSLRNS